MMRLLPIGGQETHNRMTNEFPVAVGRKLELPSVSARCHTLVLCPAGRCQHGSSAASWRRQSLTRSGRWSENMLPVTRMSQKCSGVRHSERGAPTAPPLEGKRKLKLL